VKGALGWNVVRVIKTVPASKRTFDEVKDEIKRRLLAEKAADLMYDRANKIDNILGSGAPLEQLPGDFGLAGVTGTLDAEGKTPQGEPAPIPGPPELRDAIVQAAFQTQKGDPPRLTEVQTPSNGGSAYYALEVEDITPAAQKPFEQVAAQVKADWTRDAIRKEQEEAAAKILADVKGGASLTEVAAKAGLPLRRTPLTTRAEPAQGVPPALVQPLFAAKKGEPTMVETGDGFIVAVPAEIVEPDPKADPAGYGRVQEALARGIGNDMEISFAKGLRARAEPRVNQKLLDQIAQP
jgi:peptidyl-prolyl cis-trans isomerase D